MSTKEELKKEKARLRAKKFREAHKERISEELKKKRSEKRIITHPLDTFTGKEILPRYITMDRAMEMYKQNLIKQQLKFKHLVLYGDEQFEHCKNMYDVLATCNCGPRFGQPTHYHVLLAYDNSDKFELNYRVEGRKDSYRSMDIRCIRHYIAVLHYLSCVRTSVANKFKSLPHFHSKCHSPFPKHDLTECTARIKSYKNDKYHDTNCICLRFWDKQKRATDENELDVDADVTEKDFEGEIIEAIHV